MSENRLDRLFAEKFWDRVTRKIAELLAVRGALTPAEILPELRAVAARRAPLHKQPLTPGALKKMDVRVPFGRYVDPPQDGRHARKTG